MMTKETIFKLRQELCMEQKEREHSILNTKYNARVTLEEILLLSPQQEFPSL